MTIPEQVRRLVERFIEQRDSYTSGRYKEAQVRRDFIDPLFRMLGWDVDNEKGYAEAYREVIHEDAIKMGGHTKAPDYAFRIGGQTKFFVEAKKPSVRIKDAPSPAYQLRRYAWTAKLPLSILTDFEEFAVYDCRVQPKKIDKSSTARIMYFEYADYDAVWDEIASIFSRDAVLKGSFDRFAESTKRKRGTTEVDTVFLAEIEAWRLLLARNVARRNKALAQRELNFVVQRTIDRIVFLRICEDRGIEEYGRLRRLLDGSNVYERLCRYFREADDRYNSGLFHFKQERGRSEPPDTLTPSVHIDDKALKDIIRHLYYPDSPYEFSVLPADILGQVYEQFLGKVIHLTPRHIAVVEDKPAVRKAGGVFYTPTYIVDHIVRGTVAELVKGKKPGSRGAVSKLRILDPACGSGSFLIGAYQFLLDWHRDQYVGADPSKHKRVLYQGPGGDWRLTTEERKRILTNNIYGTDIDPQAVEVTKLSLLLKVLEGENHETLAKQLRLFQERALPDLSDNIKCGNSLIDTEIYKTSRQSRLFDEEEHLRINAFDWQAEFPDIMAGGGFDAVIGNPPYIRIQALTEWAPIEVEHYKSLYQTASEGNYDIYVAFVEKGLALLNNRGRLGFILPHKFFNAKYGRPLRQLLSSGRHLSTIVHFGDEQIFASSSTYTCLLFLSKRSVNEFLFVRAHDLDAWRRGEQQPNGRVDAHGVTSANWSFVVGPGRSLFDRLQSDQVRLSDVTSRIFQGLKTGADAVYILQRRGSRNSLVEAYSKELDKTVSIEPDLLHPLVKGGDAHSFRLDRPDRTIVFPYAKNNDGAARPLSEARLRREYPLTWAYLESCKERLERRDRGKLKGPRWYTYSRTQALDLISMPKIFTPDIAARASFAFDSTGECFFTGGVAGGYGLLPKDDWSPHYLLGLLNSKILEWCLRQITSPMRGGYFSYEARYIKDLPIRDVRDHDLGKRVRAVAKELLELNSTSGGSPQAQRNRERRKIALQKELDATVYQIYELTDEEIIAVETEIT